MKQSTTLAHAHFNLMPENHRIFINYSEMISYECCIGFFSPLVAVAGVVRYEYDQLATEPISGGMACAYSECVSVIQN